MVREHDLRPINHVAWCFGSWSLNGDAYQAESLSPFLLPPPTRLSDYESLVELGARVSVSVRERDQQLRGSAQAVKVRPGGVVGGANDRSGKERVKRE